MNIVSKTLSICPHYLPTNSKQDLDHIATILAISTENLSIEQASDLCFDKVYTLCKEKKWDEINPLKKEIDHLVNSVGQSLLIKSIIQKDKELFHELVKQSIALHIPGINGNLPLHYAAEEGHRRFVEELCECNETDAQNDFDQNPLHVAAFKGHHKIVAFLLTHYPHLADRQSLLPSSQIPLKLTPVALAVLKGHETCVDLFLQKKPETARCQIQMFGSLLHLAIAYHQNHILTVLLTRFHELFLSRINEPNGAAQTPLMMAAWCGNEEAIGILSAKGARLDLTDGKGNTALHYAVQALHKNCVWLLLNLKADPRVLNQDKLEPYTLAQSLIGQHGGPMKTIRAMIYNTIHKKDSLILTYDEAENLALQGGGPKGIALVGALQALELWRFKRVSGTSAGSINAGFIAVGYSPQEMEEVGKEINMMDLLDIPVEKPLCKATFSKLIALLIISPRASINKIKRFFQDIWRSGGVCPGEKLREEIEKHIQKKTGTEFFTFKDLREGIKQGKPYKHLYIAATSIGNSPTLLDIHSEHSNIWDDVPISDAIRASSGIPGVFQPFKIHIRVDGKRVPMPQNIVACDGGLINNFPVGRFDRQKYTTTNFTEDDQDFPVYNKRTLGLSFITPKNQSKTTPDETNIKDVLCSVISTFYEAEALIRGSNPYTEGRIVRIDPLDVGTHSFNMTADQKEKLIQSGKKAVQDFFKIQDCSQWVPKEPIEPIKSTLVPMLEVGKVPGFYVFCDGWKFLKVGLNETVHIHECFANNGLLDHFLKNPVKIAFCEAECALNLIASDQVLTPKKIAIQKGQAEIIEIQVDFKSLKFTITKV